MFFVLSENAENARRTQNAENAAKQLRTQNACSYPTKVGSSYRKSGWRGCMDAHDVVAAEVTLSSPQNKRSGVVAQHTDGHSPKPNKILKSARQVLEAKQAEGHLDRILAEAQETLAKKTTKLEHKKC